MSVIWLYWFKELISGNGYFVCLACDQIFPTLMVWRWTGCHVISSGPAMTAIRNRSTSPDWMAPSRTLWFRAWTNPSASCCIPYWGESTRATNTGDIYPRMQTQQHSWLPKRRKIRCKTGCNHMCSAFLMFYWKTTWHRVQALGKFPLDCLFVCMKKRNVLYAAKRQRNKMYIYI